MSYDMEAKAESLRSDGYYLPEINNPRALYSFLNSLGADNKGLL